MKKLYDHYINNYKGLSHEIWILSFVTFINRAGAMVIPFLSLYLVDEGGFTLKEVGWIMTCYGTGSFLGNLLGGVLTDKIGPYRTIVYSLFLGGLGFISLQFLHSFWGICAGVFMLMLAVDFYRPAVFVAADVYSKEGNVTRSIGLIRLAINLGFIVGPVLGGFLIANVSYNSIFWIDGISCMLASGLLFFLLKPKKSEKKEEKVIVVKEGMNPYQNVLFLLFIGIMILNSLAFAQYFSTVPLFYKQIHLLSEDTIGWLMFINGAMIVLLEMPIIGWVERINMSKTTATFWGVFFLALSFIVLNSSSWGGVLVIGMILMTIGEMIGSPFSNALALSMAPKGRKGSYMGLYSMSWSVSHIIAHNAGMNLIDGFGYNSTWTVIFVMLVITALLCLLLRKLLIKSPNFESY